MKSIFTALAPNVEGDDAWLAVRLLFCPWRWKNGASLALLEKKLRYVAKAEHVFLFESGRTGLELILKSLDLANDDEVLLQAFTCVAVPNAIMWAGALPIYVDCREDNFTMSVEDLSKKITPKSKVLIIQHTFGNSADIDALMAIAREHKLFVIEDCAHTFRPLRGDASFYSFGRDKAISAVFGGAAATSNVEIAASLFLAHSNLPFPGLIWIKRQLLYPIYMLLVRSTYDIFIGKLMLSIARKFRFFSKPVYDSERVSVKPAFLGKRLPDALAVMALHQLIKLERFEEHRKEIMTIYAKSFRGSGSLRYALHLTRSEQLRQAAKRENIYLGDWYSTAIAPAGVSYDSIGYDPATCPTAERLAKSIINLPTDIHITPDDAQRIMQFLKNNGAT